MPIITIDGNIGSGKSSILNYLHKTLKNPVDLEPVDSWQVYLNNIYNNKSNLFNFQVRIWLDRCWIQHNTENKNIFVERSPYFIKNCFIELAKKNNLITDVDYDTLLDLHKKTDPLWLDNIYIYLKSKPDMCLTRIKKRNRQSENNITLEYLNDLHDLHEENVEKLKKINKVYIIEVEGKSISNIVSEITTLVY
jgi:deoxyadenosine/deoxycytidine kinase